MAFVESARKVGHALAVTAAIGAAGSLGFMPSEAHAQRGSHGGWHGGGWHGGWHGGWGWHGRGWGWPAVAGAAVAGAAIASTAYPYYNPYYYPYSYSYPNPYYGGGGDSPYY